MKRIKPLMQFIPALSPRYREPTHLARLVDLFERIAAGESVFATCSAPPRMYKTETVLSGIAWLLKRNPAVRIGLIGYAQDFVERKSWRARQFAARAHVPLRLDLQSKGYWKTGVDEGGLLASGVNGQTVGEGFDLIIADDLIKDRVTAESGLARDRLHDVVTDVLLPRLEPGGSMLVMGHRWHTDDPIGRLVADGWEEIRLPALDAEGRALCPERFSAEQIATTRARVGEYAFASLWMQEPRPRGSAVFYDVHHYDELPEGLVVAVGVDLAYTAKSSADASVAVVLGYDGDRYYVLDVVRQQVAAPIFKGVLEGLRDRYPGAPLVSFIGGQERGILDLLAEDGLHIDGRPAIGDKFVRAQPASAAWNRGAILLPREARWLAAFVDEVVAFTGTKDRRDDQVDALAGAFAGIATGAGVSISEVWKMLQDRRRGDPGSSGRPRGAGGFWDGPKGF